MDRNDLPITDDTFRKK